MLIPNKLKLLSSIGCTKPMILLCQYLFLVLHWSNQFLCHLLYLKKYVRRSNVHSFVLACLVFSGDCILQTAFKLTDTVFLILDLTLAPWIFPPGQFRPPPPPSKVEKSKSRKNPIYPVKSISLTSQQEVEKSKSRKNSIYSKI